jgi:zinc and cadmium transporter
MGTVLLVTAYCGAITAMSLLGGWLPRLVQMTHLRTQLLISFVAGLMLSIATVQLLPHAIEQTQGSSWTGIAVLAGILVMFLMLRTFHVHQHIDSPLRVDPIHDHDDSETCNHGGHGHSHDSTKKRSHSWVGILVGMGIHSLMDGVALAASVVADAGHGAWLGLYGLGTFIAVALHKPLDAFAITSTMQASGWPERSRSAVNMVFSVVSPLGVILFWMGASRLGLGEWVLGIGLAVSAGFFICIALADLLPEVHFHSHDRLALTGMLLAGMLVAIAIENLPGHSHGHDHGRAPMGDAVAEDANPSE